MINSNSMSVSARHLWVPLGIEDDNMSDSFITENYYIDTQGRTVRKKGRGVSTISPLGKMYPQLSVGTSLNESTNLNTKTSMKTPDKTPCILLSTEWGCHSTGLPALDKIIFKYLSVFEYSRAKYFYTDYWYNANGHLSESMEKMRKERVLIPDNIEDTLIVWREEGRDVKIPKFSSYGVGQANLIGKVITSETLLYGRKLSQKDLEKGFFHFKESEYVGGGDYKEVLKKGRDIQGFYGVIVFVEDLLPLYEHYGKNNIDCLLYLTYPQFAQYCDGETPKEPEEKSMEHYIA